MKSYVDTLRDKYFKKWNNKPIQPHVRDGLNIQFLEEISTSLEFLVKVEKNKLKLELSTKTVKDLQEILKDFKDEIKDMKKDELVEFYIKNVF